MRRFEDDDDGYLHWLGTHPDLHVLNTARNPTPAYLVLHRATCHTISGTPARGTRWTGDYIKICGRRQELDHFAHQVGGPIQPCGLCLPT